MARTNERGLELSFKKYPGQTRGRWFKTIQGKEVYFGAGNGSSDRASYRAALEKYQQHQQTNRHRQERNDAIGHLAELLKLTPASGPTVPAAELRQHILATAALEGEPVHAAFSQMADATEKVELLDRLLTQLEGMPVDQLRTMQAVPVPAADPTVRAVGTLLDDFLADQKRRLDSRRSLEALRAKGEQITEPAKENISPARYGSILRDEKSFRACCGADMWDGTEATADRLMCKYRAASEALMHAGTHTANTFNDRVKFGRMFLGWCESRHLLDRLPRDTKLFNKYQYKPTARRVPLDVLQCLWDGASETERTWLLLALNCDYYQVDISNLTGDMIEGGYIDHSRSKTAVNVRYKLWPETLRHLKRFLPAAGSVFRTEDGTPLVHYVPSKKDKDKPTRIDNVRNHFYRLCKATEVPTGKAGYSFSNLRDTASTEVEKIDKAYTDLFCCHRDERMARFYVDASHVDTSGLDAVIDKLETVFESLWNKKKRKKE